MIKSNNANSSQLKNYKPKLFIKTKQISDEEVLKGFYEEISDEKKGYSITPTTFKSRTFANGLDAPIFTEEYEFNGNSVTRFGINIHNEASLKDINEQLSEYNEGLKQSIKEDPNNDSKSISNISGATNYQKFSKHIVLTKYEDYVLENVIGYMNAKQQKIALVDTFKREFSKDKKQMSQQEGLILTS